MITIGETMELNKEAVLWKVSKALDAHLELYSLAQMVQDMESLTPEEKIWAITHLSIAVVNRHE
jgi:hypothetical protein